MRQKPQAKQDLRALSRELEQHLSAIRHRLRQPLEAEFATGNLTAPQRLVMQALLESGEMSLKQLSNQVSLAHSTVSGIVDRLEARGIVERKRDESDLRVTRIVASSAVHLFLKERAPELALHPLEKAMERSTLSERDLILRAVRKLRRLVEN